MTQSQFEQAVADRLGLRRKQTQEILDAVSEELYRALRKGESVPVRGLGRFNIVARQARWGRNPATGERIRIKASKKLRVTANKGLRDRLKVK
jgi:DNA-binding protein HU-beta